MTFNGAEGTHIHVAHTSVTAETRRRAALEKRYLRKVSAVCYFGVLLPTFRNVLFLSTTFFYISI